MKEGIFATRPLLQSFGLAQVPDIGGVRIYANNQDMGTTDKKGYLVLAALREKQHQGECGRPAP